MHTGVGKSKIVFKRKNYPLLGYSQWGRHADGQETDLNARAFLFRNNNTWIAILNLEICYPAYHLKEAIIRKLNQLHPEIPITDKNLMLCAQHTHSAPGGYSYYPFLNLTVGGFKKEVFDSYLKAGVEALVQAIMDLEPSELYLNADSFDENQDVAFNRNLDAYNLNKDVGEQDENHTHLAINRLVRQISVVTKGGINKGLINWFGVQGTSIGNKNRRIHSDNKGYAASLLENDKSEVRTFVAAFCQEASADVSPNYHGRAKWWPRGRYEDEFKSAYFNGFIQFEHAKSLLERDDAQIPLGNTLSSAYALVDFSNLVIEKEYSTDPATEMITGPAVLSSSYFQGSPVDSPGLDAFTMSILKGWIGFRNLLRKLPIFSNRSERANFRRFEETHPGASVVVELQEKRIAGFKRLNRLKVPGMPGEIINEIKRQYARGILTEHPWTPTVVPVQMLRFGEIIVAALPCDITTAAGNRLRAGILKIAEPHGILDVILCTHSNEFFGYVCTPEEYASQSFESGYTVFGINTLAALQMVYSKLTIELLTPGKRNYFLKRANMPPFNEEILEKSGT